MRYLSKVRLLIFAHMINPFLLILRSRDHCVMWNLMSVYAQELIYVRATRAAIRFLIGDAY